MLNVQWIIWQHPYIGWKTGSDHDHNFSNCQFFTNSTDMYGVCPLQDIIMWSWKVSNMSLCLKTINKNSRVCRSINQLSIMKILDSISAVNSNHMTNLKLLVQNKSSHSHTQVTIKFICNVNNVNMPVDFWGCCIWTQQQGCQVLQSLQTQQVTELCQCVWDCDNLYNMVYLVQNYMFQILYLFVWKGGDIHLFLHKISTQKF